MTQYAIEKIGYGAYCCMNAHLRLVMKQQAKVRTNAYNKFGQVLTGEYANALMQSR